MNDDRRQATRIPTDLDAVVVSNDGLDRVPARLVDQSAGGVRIRLDSDVKIGSGCYLLFGNRIEPFRVVWRASQSLGLAFTG
ncbi:PilZ domain-containing protein [Devosia rhizoryzae]|uniref:PilZ domain-containing protein n=1 Tax=Devosia rhizoryzae TaxID=2774137 RepID=A0ABX7C883_9HYPH|nr:PilZ domain-containing protein [Devosia rhizoryzae]QQR40426.1 PilZ domain-containing protein [Devosia rhizoryzae]